MGASGSNQSDGVKALQSASLKELAMERQVSESMERQLSDFQAACKELAMERQLSPGAEKPSRESANNSEGYKDVIYDGLRLSSRIRFPARGSSARFDSNYSVESVTSNLSKNSKGDIEFVEELGSSA